MSRSSPAVEVLAGVVGAEVRLVVLERRQPHHAAHGTVSERPTVIVGVTLDDGTRGWGECPALPRPTYTSEYAAGAFALLRDELVPALVAGRPVPEVVGHPMAVAAVADACLDADLRREGRSALDLLGATGGSRPWRAVVATASTDEAVAAVDTAVAQGVGSVSLKVDARSALERVDAVRRSFPALGIAVDANGTLDVLDTDDWALLDRAGLDLVEQPCPAGDWVGSARVAALLGCPVLLDESITSRHDLDTVVALDAARAVSIKPARLGGVQAGAALARDAAHRGLRVQVGGMLESAVGRAAALVVAALEVCDLPTHLGASDRSWVRDLGRIVGEGGNVDVPRGEGITGGAAVEEEVLDSLTRERVVFGGTAGR